MKLEEDKPTQPLSGEIHDPNKENEKIYATLISKDLNYTNIELSCNGEILIGRHKDCNVKLMDGTISGKHCIITPIFNQGDLEPEYLIKDTR